MRPISSPLRHARVFLVGCCVKKIERRPSKAFVVFYFCNFFSSFNSPPQKKNTPPLHSTPATHTLHHPSYRCHQLSVDCCVLGPNGGHLRPRTRPPLLFSMHLRSSAQPREPAAARANPATRRLQQTHREPRRRNFGPWQMLPWRYGAKPLGVWGLVAVFFA